MLKHDITYEDYNGDTVTETFYFNITKAELVELEVEHDEGMSAWLENITKANDRKTMIQEFKRIVLMAYGQKSPDGKRFIKSDTLREEFSQTAAFNTLFMDLAINDVVASEFIKGVLPKDLVPELEKELKDRQIMPAPSVDDVPLADTPSPTPPSEPTPPTT